MLTWTTSHSLTWRAETGTWCFQARRCLTFLLCLFSTIISTGLTGTSKQLCGRTNSLEKTSKPSETRPTDLMTSTSTTNCDRFRTRIRAVKTMVDAVICACFRHLQSRPTWTSKVTSKKVRRATSARVPTSSTWQETARLASRTARQVNIAAEALTRNVFLGSGSVTVNQTVKTSPTNLQPALRDTAVLEPSSATTWTAHHQLQFAMEMMTVVTTPMNSTATCLVRIQTSSANRVEDVSWTAGDVTETLTAKMEAMKILLCVVS